MIATTRAPTNYTSPNLQYAVDPTAPRRLEVAHGAGRRPGLQRQRPSQGAGARQGDPPGQLLHPLHARRTRPRSTARAGTPPGPYFTLTRKIQRPEGRVGPPRREAGRSDTSLAVFPRSEPAVSALLVLAGAGFVALAAQISISFPSRRCRSRARRSLSSSSARHSAPLLGPASLALYLCVGLVGAPVYAERQQRLGHPDRARPAATSSGSSLAAALTGWLAQRHWDRRLPLVGRGDAHRQRRHLPRSACPGWRTKIGTDLEGTLEAGLYPFVVGDLFKLYLAGALLPGAWRLVERFKG